ncbi:hypothetical protein HMPREF1475_01155 [Hoylesella oralis HGA0225]|nr:hypothetical protein HMPREF1475_01155 [Hoylesella oralis HGA0225]SHF49457.1 hypothetical protein SAMN05444288_0822 [Hoylesella oralis]
MFIKENYSIYFLSLYKDIDNNDYCKVSYDDIIGYSELAFNEKPALIMGKTVKEVEEKYDLLSTRADPCLSKYMSSRKVCAAEYLARCALSCTGGPFLAAAGIELATYELDECLDSSLFRYQHSHEK